MRQMGSRRSEVVRPHAGSAGWSKLRIHSSGKERLATIGSSRRNVRHRNVHNRRIGDGGGASLDLSVAISSCNCDSTWHLSFGSGALPSILSGRSRHGYGGVYTGSGVDRRNDRFCEWIAVCGRGRAWLLGVLDPRTASQLAAMRHVRRRVAAASCSATRPDRKSVV